MSVNLARVRFAMAAAIAIGGAAVTAGAVTATPASATPRSSLAAAELTSAQAHIFHENRSLGSVSCLGSSFCMGVGNFGEQAAGPFEATFSQLWNGKTWQTTPVPSVPGTDDRLNGVSCAASTSGGRAGAKTCLAVGGANDGAEISDAWNGKTWTLLPVPAGLHSSSALSGVACPATNYCVAVGSKNSVPLAQLWNGSSWSRLASVVRPPGATTSEFTGISCTAPDNCLAVGHINVVQGIHQFNYGLAESWNGQTWTILPTPPASVSGFSAVSCPTTDTCVAVGGQPVASPASAVWNGTSWTLLSIPNPQIESLNGVSCSSATNCLAVGSRRDVFQWSGGSSWQPLSNLPDLPDYTFSSVSCPRPADCMVVGFAGGSVGLAIYKSLAMSWNGTNWRVLNTGKVDQLSGVSCPSVSDCLLVGADVDQADITRTMAQTWNGKSLRLNSPHGLNGILGPVSCPTTTFCAAAENNYRPGGTETIATWDGKHWTWRPSANPDYLNMLSCASKDFCAADDEIWNGKHWRKAPFAVVSGEDVSSGISGVSCPRPHFCLAVGGWVEEPETGQTTTGMLAEVWQDSRWTIINPPSSAQGGLGHVSCLSRTNCTAIGGLAGAPGFIAAHWNGAGWKISNLPGKFTGTDWSGPSSISCATATSCMAVGSYTISGSGAGPVDVAFAWNGRTWRRTKVPGRGGIETVSCAAANQCVAVGAPDITNLAKVWNGKTWRVLATINP